MKQSEIINGNSYLFYKTCVTHRKFMEGTIVTVIGRRNSGIKSSSLPNYSMQNPGRKPIRFKLTNGHYANAGDLREIR